MASSPPSQEEPKPSPLEPETFLSRDTVFILIPCLKSVGSLQMNGGRSSSWRFKGFSTKKKQMQEPFLRSEDKYHWWRRMAGRGRQRPSSPIIRTKADEAEMSRWDEQGVKKPFLPQGAGRETPTSQQETRGDKRALPASWLLCSRRPREWEAVERKS